MKRSLSVVAALVMGSTAMAQPLGTAFTYQGALADGGTPAEGVHDLRFRLYTAAVAGVQIGSTVCLDNIAVDDGLFAAAIDFGNVFDGQERYLEVEVRRDTGLNCSSAGGFVVLSPRQAVSSAPHALYAKSAAAASMLGGQPGSFYQNASNITSGMLSDARLSSNVPRLGNANVFGFATNSFLGQVGVRTTSPLGGLHVRQEPVTFGGTLTLEGSTHSYMSFFPQGMLGGRRAFLGFAGAGSPALTVQNDSSSSGQIRLVPGPNASVTVGSGGNNIAFILDVRGSANVMNLLQAGSVCASGSIGQCSDGRYKEQVEALSGALSLVEALRPVRFEWKRSAFPDRDFSENRQAGFIAQEMQRVLPELVSEGLDGYLSVDYGRLTPFLVQALQEQQEEILQQREELELLQARNADLEARVRAIEESLGAR